MKNCYINVSKADFTNSKKSKINSYDFFGFLHRNNILVGAYLFPFNHHNRYEMWHCLFDMKTKKKICFLRDTRDGLRLCWDGTSIYNHLETKEDFCFYANEIDNRIGGKE